MNLSHHFVPSLRRETKHIESICFHIWKETPTKDIQIECAYSIVHDKHQENGFTIKPGFPKEKKIIPSLAHQMEINENVKSLDKESKCFEYICKSFSWLSTKKLKAGMFDGPDTRKLINE